MSFHTISRFVCFVVVVFFTPNTETEQTFVFAQVITNNLKGSSSLFILSCILYIVVVFMFVVLWTHIYLKGKLWTIVKALLFAICHQSCLTTLWKEPPPPFFFAFCLSLCQTTSHSRRSLVHIVGIRQTFSYDIESHTKLNFPFLRHKLCLTLSLKFPPFILRQHVCFFMC